MQRLDQMPQVLRTEECYVDWGPGSKSGNDGEPGA
jgi:hypothetical protein